METIPFRKQPQLVGSCLDTPEWRLSYRDRRAFLVGKVLGCGLGYTKFKGCAARCS